MLGEAALLSLPTLTAMRFSPKPRTIWTIVGASAIPLWATWPLLAVPSTGDIPLFQFLAMMFGVGAVSLFVLPKPAADAPPEARRGQLAKWMPATMVGFGIFVSDIFFIWALELTSPAQANLILHLWPLMVVLLGAAFSLLALRRRHLVSVALGLCGAALVIGTDVSATSWQGVVWAAAGGLAWAAFVLFRMWQGPNAPDALVGGFALSAVASLALHLATETTAVPSAGSLASTLLVGVFPLTLGNLAWDYGIRRGDRVLLSVLAYATPLVSALILIATGFASPTLGLVLGGIMIVGAGIISAR